MWCRDHGSQNGARDIARLKGCRDNDHDQRERFGAISIAYADRGHSSHCYQYPRSKDQCPKIHSQECPKKNSPDSKGHHVNSPLFERRFNLETALLSP
jgi:hypothetical protein